MPGSAVPKVAVAGSAPYMGSLADLRSLWSRHSIDIEFEEMKVGSPTLGLMVDTLEFLPKRGFVALDIWNPTVAALGDVTERVPSAREAGSVDFVSFRDSDYGLPFGHNLAFTAIASVLDHSDDSVGDVPVLIAGDGVAARGVRAGLSKHGIDAIVVEQSDESQSGSGLRVSATEATGDILDLSLHTLEDVSEPLSRIARMWHAERLRQVLEIATNDKIPDDLTREMGMTLASPTGQAG